MLFLSSQVNSLVWGLSHGELLRIFDVWEDMHTNFPLFPTSNATVLTVKYYYRIAKLTHI